MGSEKGCNTIKAHRKSSNGSVDAPVHAGNTHLLLDDASKLRIGDSESLILAVLLQELLQLCPQQNRSKNRQFRNIVEVTR
jgi:hypothetical protein